MAETCSMPNPVRMNGEHDAMSYHPDRYVCHSCKEPVKGKACRTHDGCICHETCYARYCASKCHVCNIPITDERVKYIKVADKTFHTQCYVCHSCKEPLQGKGCQVYEGKLYDTKCFAAVCASRCDKCHRAIKGNNVEFVKVGNKSFHTRCYTCYICHQNLQGVQHFTAENNMRVCVPCLTS